jgi:hypothetical protein
MTSREIHDYLLDDLINSVVNDMKPCLSPGSRKGGYFAVPRLILSYVDYLGKLYGAKHKMFIKNVFGIVDPNYAKYGNLLWGDL